MSEKSELDQVADARRRLAAHAEFSTSYWVVNGVLLALVAGLPIWFSWLDGGGSQYLQWGLVAVVLASAVHSWSRRRRSGVYLPKRIYSYPSARLIWLAGIAIAVIGFGSLFALVENGQRQVAFVVYPVLAIAVLVIQIKTRSAMRRDIESGKVKP
ncbi:hypothetical protein [Saccharopolyspora cebuensis]|uniref:Uncharacterized protein n=1 Tax=Saccharopolyspora cebuensis TaxID=418759 RepID=A0ABV4CJ25_9PSEU